MYRRIQDILKAMSEAGPRCARLGCLVLLSLWTSVSLYADEVTQGAVVREIRGAGFTDEETDRIAAALHLQVGAPVDLQAVDAGIRKLAQKGDVQSLFVEATPSDSGLQVVLRGSKKLRMRRLLLQGVISDARGSIQNLPGFGEGQPIDMRTFSVVRDRLQLTYQELGYYKAQAEIEVREISGEGQADVLVRVDSGPAARVRKVSVVGNNKEENQKVVKDIPLRIGEVLAKKRLEGAVESLKQYLRENQFQAAKVEEASLDFNPEMTEVEVVFTIRYGERLQYLFAGNTAFTDRELRALLTDEVLSQPDPSGKFAELITSRYRQVGFHFCKVRPVVLRDTAGAIKYIEMRIDQGHRVLIDRFLFTSSQDDKEDLRELFFESASGVLKRGIYREEGIRPAVAEMRRVLLAKGYLNIRLSDPKAVFTEDERGVDLVFDVELGKQTFLSSIVVTGNASIPQAEIERRIRSKAGEPFNRDLLNEDRKRVIELYSERGFTDVRLENTEEHAVELSPDQRLALVRFPIAEGRRYRVGSVHLDGNRKTRNEVILREMRLESGDYFDPTKLRQSEESIGMLGLFSRVELTAENDPQNPNLKNIQILVKENKPGVGEVGLGGWYEEPRLRVRSFVGFAYRNLFGLNQTASLRTELGLPISRGTFLPFLEYSVTLGYRAPYPFGLPFTFSTQGGLDSFEVSPQPSSLLTRARIENRIEKQFAPWLTLIYRLHRYERTTTETQNNPVPAPRDVVERVSIGSTGPSLILDLRDDTFNPSRGSYHAFDLELAHPALLSQSDIAFMMALSRNSFYVPLFSPFKLVLYAGAGYAHSLFGTSTIPTARLLNELALGGQASIRGFAPRSIAPGRDTKETAFINGRAELTTSLFNNLSFAVFFDTGQILPNLRPGVRHDGVGVGFRYKTPVGPVVIDFAQGLGEHREPVKFYFTVGTL